MRDALTGHNAAMSAVPMPELVAIAGGEVREKYASLENEEQRRGFLSSITIKLSSNWGNWAKFYEAVSLLREHEEYWKSEGFSDFDEFWREKAGPAFRSFKELEDIYNFAKTACPELFGLDFDGAKRLREQLERLKSIPALNPKGGWQNAKKRLYSGKDEAHAAVAQAMTWRNAGGTSLEYRLAKIKRDRPDVAAKILAGEFFRTLSTGQVGIDMAAAEREAYGELQRKARPAKRTIKPEESLDKRETEQASQSSRPLAMGEEMIRLVRAAAKSKAARQLIIDELRAVTWLVNGLTKDQ